jgi:outer membrane protein assembly factor BamB
MEASDGSAFPIGQTVLRIASTSVLTLAALTSLLLTQVQAQAVFNSAQGTQTGRFIEAPRAAQQQLREAERALEEERYSDAVVRLGDLLAGDSEQLADEDLAGQDFFVEVDETRQVGKPVVNSMLRMARDQIGSLPPRALETYRLRYDPLARKLLDEAAETRNWYQVREVRRRYFHTEAGYEASALLAQHELYLGNALAASLLLDDIVNSPPAIRHLGPGIVILHAAACRHASRDLPSVDSIGSQQIVVGDQSLAPPSADELQEWLVRRTGETKTLSLGNTDDYPIFGTAPDRNGDASGQLPLTNKRWDLVTTASPRQERDIREAADALMATGKLPPPSWFPIRIGNHLLMRTTERLVGVDYRTGKRVWTYPWQTASQELDQDEQSLDTLDDEQALGDLLRQRVWNDNPYGQITSDGQRVFMLDSLRKVELTPFGSLNMRGTRPADGRSNTLVALDLATEGKLLWRVGAGVDDGTELSNAFFLGPPLPLDGRLYVIAELAGDINLFCLNPATGSEIWRQQLVAVESGGIETDAVRRVAGAVPSYDNGIMICPTGAGAIVAIDLGDRMIRWGVSYSRNVGINRAMMARGRAMDVAQLMQRWHSGTAIVSENTVLVTPIESDRLLGLNLLTGASRFPQKNRINMRYLAGARDGRFIVVGPDKIRAFELQDGDELWNSPREMLASGQVISGIGVFGEGEYLLPTSTNEIIRVSLDDGTVLGRRRTRYSLGNLVAVGGEIISQGPTKLSVAFGERSLEPLVDRMLEQNPNDLDALIRKSELLIERGDRVEALQLLQRARQMDEENDEIRMLSVSALLGQLREDPTASSELIEQLDSQIDRPVQRVEYLSLLVRSALQREDFKQAVDRLVDLSSLLQANPLLEPAVKEISDESGRQSSLDDWIAARISDIYTDSSEADRVEINERLAEFAGTKRHGTTGYLEHMVRLFGPWNGIAPMRQELEQRLRDDGAFLKLERLALGTRAPSALALSSIDPDRLLSLASTYADGQLPKDAIAVLDQLDQRDGPFDRDRAAEIRQAAEAKVIDVSWPDSAQLTWESRQSSIRNVAYRQRTSPTKVQAGQQFEGWMLVSDRASAIAMRDPMGLVRRVPAERIRSRDSTDKHAQICGGFMAVMTTSGLTGIDLFRLLSGDGDAILWNRSFGPQSGSLARGQRKTTPFDDQVIRYYITTGGATQNRPELKLGPIVGDRLILLQGGELLAIDLLTSATLWRNSNAPKSGVIVTDGQRVAVVSPVAKRVDFFNLMDGRKVGSEKWIHEDIWSATETNVLAYQEGSNQKTTVKLINPFSGEVLLEHKSVGANRKQVDAPCAYGRVIEDRYMALLGSDGSTVVWDLHDGREISTAKLTPYPDLQGLQVMLLKDQIVLMPRRRQVRSRKPDEQQLLTRSGGSHQTIDGVHAISLSDGSIRWHHDFEESWGCTLTQPTETPLLMLSRSYATYTVRSRRKSIEVLAFDVRDGKELHPAKIKPVKDNVNELETKLLIQAPTSRVVASIGPEVLTYTFGGPNAGEAQKE